MPIKGLRFRSYGDLESWIDIFMFPGDSDIEAVREQIGGAYESGPGRALQHAPAVYRKGRYVFAMVSGGLDI